MVQSGTFMSKRRTRPLGSPLRPSFFPYLWFFFFFFIHSFLSVSFFHFSIQTINQLLYIVIYTNFLRFNLYKQYSIILFYYYYEGLEIGVN